MEMISLAEHSGGILPYRYNKGVLQVMLAHPGGPFWINKDRGAWSIPKGIKEKNETIIDAAKREFREETGIEIDRGLIDLGTIKQPSGKMVTIFAAEMEIDATKVKSNLFEMEWPPKSGHLQMFPENDRAEWFNVEEARVKIFRGQRGFLDKLKSVLNCSEPSEGKCWIQMSLFE